MQTKNITQVDKQNLSSRNTVKEILYESFDNNGNKYIIKSTLGHSVMKKRRNSYDEC